MPGEARRTPRPEADGSRTRLTDPSATGGPGRDCFNFSANRKVYNLAMRQFLAVSVLLALVALPTAYVFGSHADSRLAGTASAGMSASSDAAGTIIDGMRRIAEGLRGSLGRPEGPTAPVTFAAAPTTNISGGSLDLGLGVRPTGGGSGTLVLSDEPVRGVAGEGFNGAPVAAVVPTSLAAVPESPAAIAPPRHPRFAAAFGIADGALRILGAGSAAGVFTRDYPTSFLWYDLV